ncbi:hypothetical protein JCM5353_000430, partial [Sporobolomyces roseus]
MADLDLQSLRISSPPRISSLHAIPELLTYIFECIPLHPSTTCQAALARLCLVNRFFLEIARPLLYSSIRLSLDTPFDESPYYEHLTRTLTEEPRLAKYVQKMKVAATETEKVDFIVLAYILSHLALEELTITGVDFEEDQLNLAKLIVKHQPGLKKLSLPNATMDQTVFGVLFPGLPDLKEFRGRIWFGMFGEMEDMIPTIPPAFHLESASFAWGSQQEAFDYATSTSITSLRHLTITMNDWRCVHDLSFLTNLESVVFVINSSGGLGFPPPHTESFTRAIESTRNLPRLRSISFQGNLDWPQIPAHALRIFEALAPTLESISFGDCSSFELPWEPFLRTLSTTHPRLRRIEIDRGNDAESEEDYSNDQLCLKTFTDLRLTAGEDLDRVLNLTQSHPILDIIHSHPLSVTFIGPPKQYNNFMLQELDPRGEEMDSEDENRLAEVTQEEEEEGDESDGYPSDFEG